jgi:DNA-binding response OmpR family regulator
MNKKIIIVEDERPMAKALSIKLQGEGYDVENAYEGDEFFEKIKGKNFDLILLDVMLPKMSGFDILEKLKKDGINTPVIISSNLSQAEDIKKAKDLGAVDFVVKSNTSLVDFVEKIKSFLK